MESVETLVDWYCARSGIPDNGGRDNKGYKSESKKRRIVMDHSFQIRRLPALCNVKYVLENMVYGHVKCVKGWISTINLLLLRKKNFSFVAWVMIITQKIAKEDENVEYKSVTRTITSCYIFRRKLTQQIEVDMEKMVLDENQIKQRNGSGNQTLSTVSNNASQVSLMTIAVILRNDETCGKCTTP